MESEFIAVEDLSRDTETSADKAAKAAIDQMGEESGSDYTISIQRQTGTGQEPMQFVARYPLDLYTIDDIKEILQRDFGGGNYRFMVYDGKGKLRQNKLYPIASKQKKEDKSSGAIEKMLESLIDNQNKMMQAMALMHSKQAQPPAVEGRAEFLKEMLVMKQLFGGGNEAPARDSIADMSKMIGVIKQIGDMSSGDSAENNGDSESFSGLLDSALPIIRELSSIGEQKPQQAKKRQNQKPKGQANEGDELIEIVSGTLIDAARAGGEPVEVAAELVKSVPSMFLGRLKKALEDELIITKLAECERALIEYEGWMVEVLTECRRLTA